MDLKDLLNGLMADMRHVADTASMIGEPIKVGKTHMVPLLSVTIAFGTAATDIEGSDTRRGGSVDGSGAGGTMVVAPKAFVVVDADGIPQLIALKDGKYGTVQKAIELSAHQEVAALPAKADKPAKGDKPGERSGGSTP